MGGQGKGGEMVSVCLLEKKKEEKKRKKKGAGSFDLQERQRGKGGPSGREGGRKD